MTPADKAKIKCLEENWDVVTVLEMLDEDELEVSDRLAKEIDALPSPSGGKDLKDLDSWDWDKFSDESKVELCDLIGAKEYEEDEDDEFEEDEDE
jgi:hypothetical protein